MTYLKENLPLVLAILVTICFFSLMIILAFHEVPEKSLSILNILMGSLGTSWGSVINYYFGSSSGSAKKTELLSK